MTYILPTQKDAASNLGRFKLDKIKKKVRSTRVRSFDPDQELPENTAYTTWRELTDDERERYPVSPGDRMLAREEWEVNRWCETKPRGNGWEQYDQGRGTIWRRPKMTMQTVDTVAAPEITTSPSINSLPGRSPEVATSAHELSHRFEYTVPGIVQVEADFLNRRTQDEEGSRGAPRHLGAGYGRKERAHFDTFIEPYMGKVYTHDTGQTAGNPHEILSCGTEAIYAGQFGGLIGLGRAAADEDMRDFVLGVHATAGRTATPAARA